MIDVRFSFLLFQRLLISGMLVLWPTHFVGCTSIKKTKHNTTELLLFRNVVLMDFRWALKYEQVLAVSRSLYNEFLLNRVKVFSVRFDVAHFQNGWFAMTMARLAETPETL